jgi:hypothetical protein
VADILDRLQASKDNGKLFELVLQAGLKDQGFLNVQRQQSGTQFGFDLIAYRPHADGRHEVWKFECKNTRAAITVDDIAPKLIWHQGITTIDVFVIASVSPLSNSLRHLLENHDLPMRVEVWSGPFLEQVVSRSRGACDHLGFRPEVALREADSECRPEVFPPRQRCFLDVTHQMNPAACVSLHGRWRCCDEGILSVGFSASPDRHKSSAGRMPRQLADPIHSVLLESAWPDSCPRKAKGALRTDGGYGHSDYSPRHRD